MLTIQWTGVFALDPALITQDIKERLRGLANVDKSIIAHGEACLRKLIGDYTLDDLFKPAIRERLERQLVQLVFERVSPKGVKFQVFDLQIIELPKEVGDALHKSKAIGLLDEALRQLDPATKDVLRGMYQLDEEVRWNQYLPAPNRRVLLLPKSRDNDFSN